MDSLVFGQRVTVRDAAGKDLPRIALGGVVMGEDFPVVWCCREDEWEAARSEHRPPEGLPWPAEDVTAT
jgi:hypothetical protein